jgi:hypothetical protein
MPLPLATKVPLFVNLSFTVFALLTAVAYRAVHSHTYEPRRNLVDPFRSTFISRRITGDQIYNRGRHQNVLLVESAGIEPASATPFCSLHTAINLFIDLLIEYGFLYPFSQLLFYVKQLPDIQRQLSRTESIGF